MHFPIGNLPFINKIYTSMNKHDKETYLTKHETCRHTTIVFNGFKA